MAACKEAGVKDEDPLVARDKLEDWAPPGHFPPEGPPSFEGTDPKEFTKFVLEELTPWYEWATEDQEDRPCRNLLDSSVSFSISEHSWDLQGLVHMDASGYPCGKAELPELTLDDVVRTGFVFLYEGK